MGFSGQEVSEKGFPGGWDADAGDLSSQRIFRVTQLLEAMVFRPFSWDRFNSIDLRYAFHGGYIDNGVDAWLLIADGTVTLQDGATNFIERSDAGVVSVNQSGFTYLNFIPMAQINVKNGSLIATSYIDRRPEIGGAPAGTGGGTITFNQIIGVLLNNQLPSALVIQYLTRGNLPSQIAYEDEANIFTLLQHFILGIQTDTIFEETLDAGVIIEGVLIKDGDIELARRAIELDEVGGSPFVSYLGKAVPGTGTSAALWSIQRLTEATDGDISVVWADGDSDPDNIWDDRLALSYS